MCGIMTDSIEVDISPEVFKWLRESAGWSYEDVSKKIKIDIDSVKNLECGKPKLTFNQLQSFLFCYLSQYLKKNLQKIIECYLIK